MIDFPTVADQIGRALLHSVWQGAVLALLFAAATMLLRNGSAQSRYVAGCITLLLMTIVPMGTVMLRPTAVAPQQAMSFVSTPQPLSITAAMPSGTSLVPPTPNAKHGKLTILEDATIVWSVGLLMATLWQINGWITVRNLVRRSQLAAPAHVDMLQRLCDRVRIHFPITMRVCDQLTTPALVGWLRPVILIPPAALCELPVDYFESLILHELAHVRRHDYLVNLLQTAAETLLFYHPAAWWIGSRIRQEREHCCDDQAAFHASPFTYVRALASMEALRSGTSPRLVLAASDGNLLRRIQRLTTAPRRSRGAVPVIVLAVIALGIVALLPSHLLQHAGAKPQMSRTQPATSRRANDSAWTYRFAPADRIELTVRNGGASDIVQTTSVDAQGNIALAVAPDRSAGSGKTIHAAGRTPKELERDIANALATDSLSVRVVALDADNSFYFVAGHVKRPGSFQMMYDRPTIGDAITNAGGITELHEPGKFITVVREWPAGAGKRRINLDTAKVLANDPLSNIEVRPGDDIQVGTTGTALADGQSATRPATERASATPVRPGDRSESIEPPPGFTGSAVAPGMKVYYGLYLDGRGPHGPQFMSSLLAPVSKSGDIRLDLLMDKPIHVDGLSYDALKSAMNKAYSDAGYDAGAVQWVRVSPPTLPMQLGGIKVDADQNDTK